MRGNADGAADIVGNAPLPHKPPNPVPPKPSPGTPAFGLQQPQPFPGGPNQAADFRDIVSGGAWPAGPVQPTRARVSSSVERGTLKLRHTLALLAPPSSAETICSTRSGSSAGGRPPLRPRRLAAARPATTRSRVRARSYWASAPKMPNSSSPCGVVVSHLFG